jgi:hypothetical protein
MSAPDASVIIDASAGIMWSPAPRKHSIPASKLGFSTATPHKTVLQIMRHGRTRSAGAVSVLSAAYPPGASPCL